MPEGHSVHRIARQFARNFVGRRVAVSSPQGRFAEGASQLDGHVMTDARATGKQMFLEFDNGLWLRVHLGLYGAWDFAGEITTDATIRSAGGRIGQTNQHGTVLDADADADADADGDGSLRGSLGGRPDGSLRGSIQGPLGGPDPLADSAGEDSVHSIGAPRKARLHMAEQEKENDDPDFTFPPDPVGQVRVRLLTDTAVADLRGPTACEVIVAEQVQATIDRLGPDPIVDSGEESQERFVRGIRRTTTPIGALLMDQSIVGGIGNVYRAELLFRARLNPYTPGKQVPADVAASLWTDWAYLLGLGVATGQMMTMDDLDDEAYAKAMASRDDRHWVYKREGLPCRVCGTNIVMEPMGARKLYWCPVCQA